MTIAKGVYYDDEAFLRAWMATEDTGQCARRLGITRKAVERRARRMRDRGVDLPPQRVCP